MSGVDGASAKTGGQVLIENACHDDTLALEGVGKITPGHIRRKRTEMIAPALPPKCLVVDDEPRLRQVMVHLMRGDGFD
ncbi:MAG TPA: hypothetical protein VHV78_07925, partial [Gemmatimonadaceae bacterium]|nr:hypothetical protein [Gemmatimonadaceae bacterium]